MKCFVTDGSALAFGWKAEVHKKGSDLGVKMVSQQDYYALRDLIQLETRLVTVQQRMARLEHETKLLQQRINKTYSALGLEQKK
jgi:hypothetical protein